MACGQAPQPSASIPPTPSAPADWVTLASVGSDGGPGFTAFSIQTGGRPLALHVVCVGGGTLFVTVGHESDTGSLPAIGDAAVAFPCSTDPSATVRHEIAADLGRGELTVAGGVVPGAGELSPSVFVVALEEAAS